MLCSLTSLKDQDLGKIRDLEGELGQTLLAFSCHSLAPAELAADKLEKIQALEKSLGISLVAVKS